MEIIQSIQNRIYEVRGERVMLDKDLAVLYEIEPRSLNQAVKRNKGRFPPDFLFQLTLEEWNALQEKRTAFEDLQDPSRSQIVILNTARGQNIKYLPYVYTEFGIAMLSSVLHSEKAIQMNIAIMRAFVAIRHVSGQQMDLKVQLREIKDRIGAHDAQLNQIYDALENLLDEKAAASKWEDRERIGY